MNRNPAFSVTILGNSSAAPANNRHLSAQMILFENRRFLVDCGEGTQNRLVELHVRQANLDHILISHLHGDHFYGLFGLISTLHLYGREKPLALFAPAALKELLIEVLKVSETRLMFQVEFLALEDFVNTPLINDDRLLLECFPVNHRIATWGFKFSEQPKKRKIKLDFIEKFDPTIAQIKAIKSGEGFVSNDGQTFANDEITEAPRPSRSYAYCADTAYYEPIIEVVQNANLIYHEATFDSSMEQIAADKFHSTAKQAATIAQKARVERLLIGHFSARYKDLTPLLEEAREIFPETYLSEEGTSYPI
ncbi:MAG: ribonuclease Z [Bacteroidales bacterium]|nr:ribonuclease Z [Bacteroidales bacterium]